jgi:hypothetical protein
MLPLVILLAVGLSAMTYGWLEPSRGTQGLGALRRSWLPFVCRAVAWAALGMLLADLSCAMRRNAGRPLVLLDASLSLGADSGRWQAAKDSATKWGEVMTFGDERARLDTVPSRGRSLLAPALHSAAASDRPIIVVSDGEIEDAGDLAPDLVARASVRLFPRRPGSDLAITLVEGPSRVTAGDSVPLEVTVRAYGTTVPASVSVAVMLGAKKLAEKDLRPTIDGESQVSLVVPSAALRPDENLLSIQLVGAGDAEPKDDTRLYLVTVTPTPGVVLLANPGDWDSRFLYRTLLDVAQLPVRGYLQVEPGRWRTYAKLAPVSTEEVRRAARHADLLIVKGDQTEARSSGARGLWLWPSGESGTAPVPGDWYLTAAPSSPIAGAFVGLPVDSFPPAIQITPMPADSAGWVALTAQNGRRGGERPVVIGRVRASRREVTVLADGLWRWAFRGGSSEEGYRSWVAATASWLLGGADSSTGHAKPVRNVVANQRPIIFEWLGGGAPSPLEVVLNGEGTTRRDTLRFDGGGHAAIWLPVGSYHYRLEGGGGGVVAVEEYSDEWLPRPAVLQERRAAVLAASSPSVARGWLWLFGLCLLGVAGEWLGRRRLGLR